MSHDAPFQRREGNTPQQAPQQQQPSFPPNIAPALQAQQMAFQQNGALPFSDTMQRLAQMNVTPEQIIQMAQMLQSGQFPPPPANKPTQPPTANPVAASPPNPRPTEQPSTAMAEDEEGTDMEIEEGEVEEDEERINEPQARGFLKTPPKGPRQQRQRTRSRSPQWRFDTGRARMRSPVPAPRRSPSHQRDPRQPVALGNDVTASLMERAQQQKVEMRALAKDFVTTMYSQGYDFDAIAKHIDDQAAFKRFWAGLALPDRAATRTTNIQDASKASAKRSVSQPKPPPPQDRQAYLERLKAAKNKKNEPAPSPPTSAQPQPTPIAAPRPQSANQTPQPAKRTIDNNLVRQRLEALKAQQAERAARAAANGAAPSSANPPTDLEIASSSASTNGASGNGTGLPGLFNSGAATVPPSGGLQNSAMSSRQAANNNAPTPVLSRPGSVTLPGNNTPRRPFGMSRTSSREEQGPVVIVESDDDSDVEAKTREEAAKLEAVTTRPFDAFPAHIKTLEEARRKLAEMERKKEEKKLKRERLVGLNTGTTPTDSVCASEVDTPAGEQAPNLPTSGTGSPAVQMQLPHSSEPQLEGGQGQASDDLLPEPESAVATPNSFDDVYGESPPQQTTHADSMQAPQDIGSVNLPQATEDADDDGDDMDIEDEDDLDDIYDQPAAPTQPATIAPTVVQASDGQDEDEDDGESAMDMDTSSDTTSEADDYYGDTKTNTDQQADIEVMPVSLPSSPVPVQQQLDIYDPEDLTGPETNGAAVGTPAYDDEHADDELTAELQPSGEELAAPESQPSAPSKFTPYVSPLASFKDFRYHPEFLATVPGGFKSLTYNHKIDANKPVCRFETAGGICNDKTCEGQHFRDMALSDNDLLKRMGAEEIPAKKPDEVKKWKSGLASMIAEIRSQNQSKDVGTISRRIAEYRREFVGDPSNILLLDVEL